MARRLIGQEAMGLGDVAPPKRGTRSLDEIAALIDWAEIDRCLAPIYSSSTGEQAWPPLAMVKALLLSIWYDLSDVKLAETLDDRASFRRFCGFAASEATPERTAFVRFRRELVARSLDLVLFEAVSADDHDTMAQARLAAIAEELDNIEQAIVAGASGTLLPWSLADVFARIAVATEHCERLIEDHANGAHRVSDDTLLAIATTLRMVREVTTVLVQVAAAAAAKGA